MAVKSEVGLRARDRVLSMKKCERVLPSNLVPRKSHTIMPPRGGSSRVPRPNRGSNQKRGPNARLAISGSSDRPSLNKFEYIPFISRSSGIEHDGDTYARTVLHHSTSFP